MITYFKMKKNEWKVKAMFYGVVATFYDKNKQTLESIQKMYNVLKDVPPEELQKELVTKLAEIIHEEGNNKIE